MKSKHVVRNGFFALIFLAAFLHQLSDAQKDPRKKRGAPSFKIPPDVRPAGCASEILDPDGKEFSDLKVSIIIPYKNEQWEHIQGSLESILYYTPKKYMNEIMFVSDGNGPDNMFAHELRSMSKLVTIFAMPGQGVGLIEAKMRAVAGAAVSSSVLVFLEPHVRVNRQWLLPLLRRIRLYPRVVAMPLLDVIPASDWNGYEEGIRGHWRFEWNFNLLYSTTPERGMSANEAYPTPATSGGIFAVRRDWWNKLGFYDVGMFGWGGDHIEVTLKAWRCGGHIEAVPCSRVGHMFRQPEQRPYPVEVEQVVRNYGRIAKVWLEDYISYFYKVKPEAANMDLGNLTAAFAEKERLQCKDMKWYLENVDIEMGWEASRICIPGCDRRVEGDRCCKNPGWPSRSTIDRIMPESELAVPEIPDHSKDEL